MASDAQHVGKAARAFSSVGSQRRDGCGADFPGDIRPRRAFRAIGAACPKIEWKDHGTTRSNPHRDVLPVLRGRRIRLRGSGFPAPDARGPHGGPNADASHCSQRERLRARPPRGGLGRRGEPKRLRLFLQRKLCKRSPILADCGFATNALKRLRRRSGAGTAAKRPRKKDREGERARGGSRAQPFSGGIAEFGWCAAQRGQIDRSRLASLETRPR